MAANTTAAATAPVAHENGAAYYTGPIPGIDVNRATLLGTYAPHLEYMHYGNVVSNKRGGKMVYLKPYRGCGVPLRLQLCTKDAPLRMPFGMSAGKIRSADGGWVECGDPNRLNLDLSIDNDDLRVFLERLDAHTLAMARARAAQWFGPHVTPDAIKTMYKPLVTMPSAPAPAPGEPPREYNPTLRCKVALEGPHATRVYTTSEAAEDGECPMRAVSVEALRKEKLGAYAGCVPLVDVLGVWIMASPPAFGVTLQLCDVLLIPRSERPAATFVLDSNTHISNSANGDGNSDAAMDP